MIEFREEGIRPHWIQSFLGVLNRTIDSKTICFIQVDRRWQLQPGRGKGYISHDKRRIYIDLPMMDTEGQEETICKLIAKLYYEHLWVYYYQRIDFLEDKELVELYADAVYKLYVVMRTER